MLAQIIVLAILILINAFFAASEIAFISLNDAKIEKQAKEGNKKAKQIEKMLQNPSKFLATIQIGITLAGFLSSAFASDAFAIRLAPVLTQWMPFFSLEVWKGISIILITIILSFFTLIFGELVPKRLAMKNYEKISFASIGFIRTLSAVTAPFVKLLTIVTNGVSKLFGVGEREEETVTEEEIKMMIDQGQEKGTIEIEEKELLNNVFEFNDITASEIMTHRTDIFAVDKNISLEELLEQVAEEDYRYSRIPVYEETVDEIQGILYMKDILKNIHKKSFKVKNIMKEPYFVPQNKMIDELFKEMQKNNIQMAIIVDEYGGTAGLVTMEDILEELVGDIYDEYDEVEQEYEKIDQDTYILSGSMTIYDVNKLIGADIPEGDYDTLSGFLQEKMGRIPEQEEAPIIETEKITYKIEEQEDKRIMKVKAAKNHPITSELEQEKNEEEIKKDKQGKLEKE
jgi:putative hemolysin